MADTNPHDRRRRKTLAHDHTIVTIDVAGFDEGRRGAVTLVLNGKGIRHEWFEDSLRVATARRDETEAVVASMPDAGLPVFSDPRLPPPPPPPNPVERATFRGRRTIGWCWVTAVLSFSVTVRYELRDGRLAPAGVFPIGPAFAVVCWTIATAHRRRLPSLWKPKLVAVLGAVTTIVASLVIGR